MLRAEPGVSTIDLGGGPEFAMADGQETIYMNIGDENELVFLDSSTLVCSRGSQSSNASRLGRRFRKGHPVLPELSRCRCRCLRCGNTPHFASTREGMIHIFHEEPRDKFSAVESVKTEYGAKTLGLDTKTTRFSPSGGFCSTHSSNRRTSSSATGSDPEIFLRPSLPRVRRWSRTSAERRR